MTNLKKTMALVTVLSLIFALSLPVLAEEGKKVNINTAGVEDLVKLKQVGAKYASAIVAYREANGPFKSGEEIMKVRGIGEKTYEAIKGDITVK